MKVVATVKCNNGVYTLNGCTKTYDNTYEKQFSFTTALADKNFTVIGFNGVHMNASKPAGVSLTSNGTWGFKFKYNPSGIPVQMNFIIVHADGALDLEIIDILKIDKGSVLASGGDITGCEAIGSDFIVKTTKDMSDSGLIFNTLGDNKGFVKTLIFTAAGIVVTISDQNGNAVNAIDYGLEIIGMGV